jgi:hypothetical protein
MRKLESWMQKDAPVVKSGIPGFIRSFSVSTVGKEKMIHSITVQNVGVSKPYPVNAHHIDPVHAQAR